MAAYQNDLWDALVVLIGATWPEVKDTGIDRARQMARSDWEKEARDGKLPRCVIDLRPGPASSGGVCNRRESVQVTVSYVVGADDEPDCEALIAKAQELQQALWPDDRSKPLWPAGQVEAYPVVSDSMEMRVNDYFLRSRQPFWACAVMFSVLVGEKR